MGFVMIWNILVTTLDIYDKVCHPVHINQGLLKTHSFYQTKKKRCLQLTPIRHLSHLKYIEVVRINLL